MPIHWTVENYWTCQPTFKFQRWGRGWDCLHSSWRWSGRGETWATEKRSVRIVHTLDGPLGTRHYGSNFVDLGNHRFWSYVLDNVPIIYTVYIYIHIYIYMDGSYIILNLAHPMIGTQWLDPYQSSRFGVVFFANWQPEPRRTKTFSRDATTMLSRLDPRILQGFGPKKDA